MERSTEGERGALSRWVRLGAIIIVLVAITLFLVMFVVGGDGGLGDHGPSRHGLSPDVTTAGELPVGEPR
jgi:hypothetical protein